MLFKQRFKGVKGVCGTDVEGQFVPQFGGGDREGPITSVYQPRSAFLKDHLVGGSKGSRGLVNRDQIGEVIGSRAIKSFKGKKQNFELDTLFDR